jgi:pyridoxal phosphate enzyme (YggS family)
MAIGETSPMILDITANLAAVQARIAEAAEASGRDPADITLVAVGKTHGAERIQQAIEAGQTVFGENRVQEAQAKFPALKEHHPEVRLHLIGPLQTNKAKGAVELFDAIETLDRAKLARILAREFDRTGRRPPCFIQINTGEEPQKAGVLPGEADAFIAHARDELELPVVGLMCIPPVAEAPALHYALLAKIAERNGLSSLSMGMSADYETAIRFGATHVRVGSAIFGPRQPR